MKKLVKIAIISCIAVAVAVSALAVTVHLRQSAIEGTEHGQETASQKINEAVNAITNTNENTISTESCNKSLWDHVYNPQRLKIIDSCKTVTGVIDNIRVEKDGDYHIRLHLDPEFTDLINDANVNQQHGDLVLEPICENTVEQEDAIDSCSNFSYPVDILPVVTHVKVIGSYVLDLQHDGWAEIHPVTSIEEIK